LCDSIRDRRGGAGGHRNDDFLFIGHGLNGSSTN
jgi:hypothetical protein